MKLLLFAWTAAAASSSWLQQVEPIISPSEKQVYLGLPAEARVRFEQDFWAGKSITAQEYFVRLTYADSKFGSAANTDQGRIYLSLGPPSRITRLPSSRIFVPLEIWYYDSVPGVVNTELRLLFFQPRSLGFPKLYSPTVDTIRALLVPQASTRSIFGPNDSVTESDIRRVLKTGPAEDEVIPATVAVASGIKHVGNDEILGRITSPREMLAHEQRTEVQSRLIVGRPRLEMLVAPSPYGGAQVDFRLDAKVRREVMVEVLQGPATVYRNQVQLSNTDPAAYTHRLDLLPGSYRIVFTVDGTAYPYSLEVPAQTAMGEIVRADAEISGARHTPFEFAGQQLELNAEGRYAAVPVTHPATVTWRIRRGAEVVWKATVEARQLALIELPVIPAGVYRLEAVCADDARTRELVVKKEPEAPPKPTVISFNANLSHASRLAFIGHQWLLRGNIDEARRTLNASLHYGETHEAQVDLARADAMSGDLDGARERVRKVLAARPDDFEALSVFAYIETRFQDYEIAAELYRRAVAIQDSAALRAALAQLPSR